MVFANLEPGLYFLAISGFDRDPVSGDHPIFPRQTGPFVFGPTGPGGANPITGWTGTAFSGGKYIIDLENEGPITTPPVQQPLLVPEPTTLLLFGTTAAGLGLAR
jgi:PEP-CTERM motif-containing protein